MKQKYPCTTILSLIREKSNQIFKLKTKIDSIINLKIVLIPSKLN